MAHILSYYYVWAKSLALQPCLHFVDKHFFKSEKCQATWTKVCLIAEKQQEHRVILGHNGDHTQ